MNNATMTITFYPVGNGDTTLVKANDGRMLLFDYNHAKTDDEDDKRIDLPEELRRELDREKRNDFDVVMFSHADNDHYCRFSEFFYLNHAKKYQDDQRVKMKTLWVPAKVLIETALTGEAAILRAEARHRLMKEKSGILVFGGSEELDSLLSDNGISPDKVSHLRIGAGNVVPGFSATNGGMELFVHSPHSWITDDSEEQRNNPSIVLQIRFYLNGTIACQCILGADAEYRAWCSIYKSSLNNKNLDRLDWNLFRVSHHCSYTALSDEKGKTMTVPMEEVAKIFERGSEKCYIVSSSNPIPDKITDHELPPHKPTAAYYESIAEEKDGKFFVTMEYPTTASPKPLTFEVTQDGFNKKEPKSLIGTGVATIVTERTPRHG